MLSGASAATALGGPRSIASGRPQVPAGEEAGRGGPGTGLRPLRQRVFASSHMEDAASAAVDLASAGGTAADQQICCRCFPEQRETKVAEAARWLGTLWRQNPNEKIVIFATYLGTVDLIAREIEQIYPGQGVVVLRGGDHGAKVAAERRFS